MLENRHHIIYNVMSFLKCAFAAGGMFPSLLTDGGVRHDDHNICVGGEDVNEGCKVGVPHLHALERGCEFTGSTKSIK